MIDQLIKLETAKLAKEKKCKINNKESYRIDKEGNLITNGLMETVPFEWEYKFNHNIWYPAPTQSLLQKWLRETYSIHCTPVSDRSGEWSYLIYFLKPGEYHNISDIGTSYKTYEDALEVALVEGLGFIDEINKYVNSPKQEEQNRCTCEEKDYESHGCPYAHEINDDDNCEHCSCCPYCVSECSNAI